MRYLLLLLLFVQAAQAETLSVIHRKHLRRDGRGTVKITEEGIVYRAQKAKDSRTWRYQDIQYFDRISEREFVVLTYEDSRLKLGRDRQYRFLVTEGKLSDELFETVARGLGRPVTDRVAGDAASVEYQVPVKHLHTLGGCEGTLQFTGDAIYYRTGHAEDGRAWQLARDVQSVWSADRYQLEIHAYDNNRREFSRTRVYKFDLKQPLDPAFYRTLTLKLYRLEAAHLPLP